MTGLPEVGAVVRWGPVRYEVIGHYCGGRGKRCRHGERAVAAYVLDRYCRRLYSPSTVCLDAAKLTAETGNTP